MSKHTPGTWLIGDSDLKCSQFAVIGKSTGKHGTLLRMVHPQHGMPIGEIMANARLIAASPDLYAVLKELQESAQYWSEYDVPLGIVDRINQAIAKAEGTK